MNPRIYSRGREVFAGQEAELPQEEAVGVFETMRVYRGKVSREEEHLQRLFESAKTVGYRPLPDPREVRREIASALRASGEKNTSVRLTLCRGKIFVMVGARKLPGLFYKTGVALKTASFPRGGSHAFPHQVKVAAYQQAILASTEPNPGKAFDWLFLDRGDFLTETRTGNFFLVKYAGSGEMPSGVALLTPPEHLILNGVVRRFVIKCALETGFRVLEVPLTRHDFFNADEAFLTNTSWEILPVRELDGRVIGTKIPGPVTRKLHRLFKRRI